MKTAWIYMLGIAAIITLAGCSSSTTLTRGHAKDLLEHQDWFKPTIVPFTLSQADADMGVRAGYWTRSGVSAVLTSKGKQYFTGGTPGFGDIHPIVTTIAPCEPHIEVTGITDNIPQGKVVEFGLTMTCEHLPDDLRKQLEPSLSGVRRMVFLHYDDGWRVAN